MTNEKPGIPAGAQRLTEMPRRTPINGTFELTVRCNLHCKMCLFRHADSENASLMAGEMTAAEWIDMARQAAEAGTINLLITGGEPLLRPDFCEIWEGIYKQGFVITLYTNATLVNETVMQTLRKYPPHKIGVTIYGASGETYQKVCGDAKAFERAIAGIHQLQTLPSVMEFRTTIIKDNFDDADAIEELVQREFGEKYIVAQPSTVISGVRGACTDVPGCRLSPSQNASLAFRRGINIIKKKVGDKYDERNLVIRYNEKSHSSPEQRKLTLLGCNAGMSSYALSWDGKLLACQLLGIFSTNAQENGFLYAWKKFPFVVSLPDVDTRCQNCANAKYCETCPAFRYAETGSLSGFSPYACEIADCIAQLIEKE